MSLAMLLTRGGDAHAQQRASPGASKKAATSALSTKASAPNRVGALFARVPAGANAIFAVSLAALAGLIEDPLFEGIFSKGGIRPIASWEACVLANVEPDAMLILSSDIPVGGWQSDPERFTLRFFVSGLALATLAQCLKHPTRTVELSTDEKLLTVAFEASDPSQKTVYLEVAGGIYSIQRSSPVVLETVVERAELDRELATLARANASTDGRLAGDIASLDAENDLWFLFPSTRTPWRYQFATSRVEASFRGGLSMIWVTRFFTAARAREAIQTRWPQLRSGLQVKTQRIPAMHDSIRSAKLDRSGKEARVSLVRNRAQLEALLDAAGDLASLLD